MDKRLGTRPDLRQESIRTGNVRMKGHSPVVLRVQAIMGITAAALFVAVYIVEFFPHVWPTVTLRWMISLLGWKGVALANVVIFAAFVGLLPYRRPSKGLWKSQGVFVAFAVALMTEM